MNGRRSEAQIEIQCYEPTFIQELHAVYQEAVARVPHCYPVDRERFVAALPAPSQAADDANGNGLRDERVLLARESGQVVGFLHLGVREPMPAPEELERNRPLRAAGAIRFFWYRRGHRAAGQALLDAAELFLAEHELSIHQMEAFHYDYTYPFYHVEHAFLSDRLDHVHALLGFNGYHRCSSELVLDWPDYSIPDPGRPAVNVELSRKWTKGSGARPGLVLTAHLRDRQVGVCVCVSLYEVARVVEADDWVYTRWLGIEEDYQGRGLGRFLLLSALRDLHTVGYRHATICTFGDNYRAFLLYSNLGYHVIDWTYAFRKKL
ncbi:MAG: GNAT family N-acetyltransferase [Chloroflexi bacterium]|nr:GNAT family N-acetyltransferase [Chloroflexota bacterium]